MKEDLLARKVARKLAGAFEPGDRVRYGKGEHLGCALTVGYPLALTVVAPNGYPLHPDDTMVRGRGQITWIAATASLELVE